MLQRLGTVLLLLTLTACKENPAPSTPAPTLSGVSIINAETGGVIPGLESITNGSTVDLSQLGGQEAQLRVNTAATELGKVDLTLDGEVYTDHVAPYTYPASRAAQPTLGGGNHIFSATPYTVTGVAGTPFTISFSVKAPDYKHYLYVFRTSAIDVYDIDDGHSLVKSLKLPRGIERIWGAAAHADSGRLYISYHGRDGERFERGLLAYDLIREEVVWKRLYQPFVDSPAITADGKTIYLSSGEATDRGDFWFVLDAADGSIKDKIEVFRGAHNTIVGLGGKNVYLGSVRYPYLVVADTATNKVTKEIGPFRAGIRPFRACLKRFKPTF